MKNFVTTLLLVVGAAFPYVVGLHIEPVKAQWSGWALGDENHGVFQGVTCNFREKRDTSPFLTPVKASSVSPPSAVKKGMRNSARSCSSL